MPKSSVDLPYVAKNVGYTSRETCSNCHFYGGGGNQIKHADLGAELRYPSKECDIHMGGYDFSCTECHQSTKHKIPGRSSSVAATEGAKRCVDCHTEDPHYGENLLDHHLNEHSKHIACNTCHSPVYAKCHPTKTWWDWSQAGDKDRKVKKDEYGKPLYHWKKGVFEWKRSAKPDFAWYNGYTKRVLAGDKVNLEGKVVEPENPKEVKQKGEYISLTEPVGSKSDPDSKITPFKVMRGVQGADPKNKLILVPHLFPYGKNDKTAYWKNLNWNKAFAEGMEAMDLPYSGDYVWVRTNMYWRIEHEVMPEEFALSCRQCHQSLKGEKTCNRCHKKSKSVNFQDLMKEKRSNFEQLQRMGRDVRKLKNRTDYINFEELGYDGDPIIHGGRFKKLPIKSE